MHLHGKAGLAAQSAAWHLGTHPARYGTLTGDVSENYVLNVDGHWIPDETVTIAGIIDSVGNEVGITGTATCVKISDAERYSELTIKSIYKQSTPSQANFEG